MKKKFSLGENWRRAVFVLGFLLLAVSWYRSTPARTETAPTGTYSDILPTERELKGYRFWNGVGALFCLGILGYTEVRMRRQRRQQA